VADRLGGIVKPDTRKGFRPNLHVGPDLGLACRQVDRLDGELDRLRLTPFLVEQVLRWASVQNAWSSTALEGNPTPLARAAALVEPGVRPRNKDEREIRRLIAYYRSLERLRKTDEPERLTLDQIRQLHEQLLDGVVEGPVGKWKTRANYIAGARGVVLQPTPPPRVEAELRSLLAWYRGEGQGLHPAARVAVFFHEFESIHPFRDGNGRVGRALCQRLLVGEGLPNVLYVPLDAVLTRAQDLYYETLRITNQTGNFRFWAEYFVSSLVTAYREAIERADVGKVVDSVPTGVARAVLQHVLLAGTSTIRSAELEKVTGYSRPAIVLGLNKLQELGILEPRGAGPSTHYVLRPDYLERIFGGDPPRRATRTKT
jgi:Fic family protein